MDNIVEALWTELEQVKKLGNPVATVALALVGLYLLFGTDSQKIRNAKTIGAGICAGLFLINCGRPVVEALSKLFSGLFS